MCALRTTRALPNGIGRAARCSLLRPGYFGGDEAALQQHSNDEVEALAVPEIGIEQGVCAEDSRQRQAPALLREQWVPRERAANIPADLVGDRRCNFKVLEAREPLVAVPFDDSHPQHFALASWHVRVKHSAPCVAVGDLDVCVVVVTEPAKEWRAILRGARCEPRIGWSTCGCAKT